MTTQLQLFDRPLVQLDLPRFERGLSIAEQFEVFHAANPHVYTTLVAMARYCKAQGRARVGMKALFERLRWEWHEQTQSDDDYKLNNNYTAYYARLIMRRERDLAGFFETRERRGNAEIGMTNAE